MYVNCLKFFVKLWLVVYLLERSLSLDFCFRIGSGPVPCDELVVRFEMFVVITRCFVGGLLPSERLNWGSWINVACFCLRCLLFDFILKQRIWKKKVFFQHSAENINDSCLFYNFLECLKLKQCSTDKK